MDIKFSLFETSKNENSNLVLSFSNYRHMFNQSDEYSAFFGKKYPNKTREKHLFNLQRKGLLYEQAYEALKKAKMVESVEASLSIDVGSRLKSVSPYNSSKEENQVTLAGYQSTEDLRAFQTKALVLKKGSHLAVR
ncbi:hypothetical protein WDV81_03020 [Streptococcus agalactiae]